MNEDWKERLRSEIAGHAVSIEDLFAKSARPMVTIFIRTPGLVGDGDVLVTSEPELRVALAAMERWAR